jgi:hypothetical protein
LVRADLRLGGWLCNRLKPRHRSPQRIEPRRKRKLVVLDDAPSAAVTAANSSSGTSIVGTSRSRLERQINRPALAPDRLGDLRRAHALLAQLNDPRAVELDRPTL